MEPFRSGAGDAERDDYFERAIWPHLSAAYSFARWMVRDHHDAEDVVQESFTKAFRAAGTFRGSDIRPWLMAIVRNCALSFLRRSKRTSADPVDEAPEPVSADPDPEATLFRSKREQMVRRAIERLPAEFREVLLLREMEGMAYKEIAYVLKLPIGTVMSRLSRARALLMEELIEFKETVR